MRGADEEHTPVRAKAFLIDPASMTVVWMNESASQDPSAEGARLEVGEPVDVVVPVAETLGVPDAVRAVAETGDARHLHAGLISTNRGSMQIAVSIYRIPDGSVLLLMENAWQPAHGKKDAGGPRRPRRGAR